MNIIILTCPQLSSRRVPVQVLQLIGAISRGLISNVHIICMDDSKALHLAKVPYKPDQWTSDIAVGWSSFKENIKAQIEMNAIFNCFPNEPLLHEIFPFRKLTVSEHSITYRHVIAINKIALSTSPCLVLEDDALIEDELLFYELLEALGNFCKYRIFYDLTDNYISIRRSLLNRLEIGGLNFFKQPFAVTRTLMAYAMSPDTARLLISSFKHYSLPIDMQLQVLLAGLCLPGVSIDKSPFRHGSKSGEILSSVRQN